MFLYFVYFCDIQSGPEPEPINKFEPEPYFLYKLVWTNGNQDWWGGGGGVAFSTLNYLFIKKHFHLIYV